MDNTIANLMEKLGITEEEALELQKYDEGVDKGTIKDNLTAEQKKAIKKMTNVTRAVNAYGKEVKKEIKADDVKQFLISYLAEMLGQCDTVSDVSVLNPQKLIGFKMGDDDFELDLKRKRKKK